jgi:hypothetical protein
MKNEIIFYQPNGMVNHLEIKLNDETVWLNRQQMAILFDRDIKTIGKHISSILREELKGLSVVAKFATTAADGKVYHVEHYNLDMIISLGYRVKSSRGIQFRIWANEVIKDYLLKGYAVNNRINRIEDQMESIKNKVDQIDFQLHTQLIPTQGIFFDGQVFDAYAFASRIIRSAMKNIVLIDNYLDESTFTHLSKKKKGVPVRILTKSHSKQIQLDLKKANEQYGGFELRSFDKSHDRFLIIDDQEVYHLGASLKDLGKRWFAFSKLNPSTIIQLLKQYMQLSFSSTI